MRKVLATLGAACAVALPVAFAQAPDAAQPAPQTPGPQAAPPQQTSSSEALLTAMASLHVSILQAEDGGVVLAQGQNGDSALMVFITPQVAETERQRANDETLQVGIIDLATVFANWDGAIIFRSSPEEVAKAHELDAESGQFLAPVFFVMAGDVEARIATEQGPITPILTAYSDAESLAAQLSNSDEEIEIVPIELAALLRALQVDGAVGGYQFFTHPQTVSVINARPAETSPPQGANQ